MAQPVAKIQPGEVRRSGEFLDARVWIYVGVGRDAWTGASSVIVVDVCAGRCRGAFLSTESDQQAELSAVVAALGSES